MMIVLTPHDVLGKFPKIEGDKFKAIFNRSIHDFELVHIIDNRLYARRLS